MVEVFSSVFRGNLRKFRKHVFYSFLTARMLSEGNDILLYLPTILKTCLYEAMLFYHSLIVDDLLAVVHSSNKSLQFLTTFIYLPSIRINIHWYFYTTGLLFFFANTCYSQSAASFLLLNFSVLFFYEVLYAILITVFQVPFVRNVCLSSTFN